MEPQHCVALVAMCAEEGVEREQGGLSVAWLGTKQLTIELYPARVRLLGPNLNICVCSLEGATLNGFGLPVAHKGFFVEDRRLRYDMTHYSKCQASLQSQG